jgi:hypothetical protein
MMPEMEVVKFDDQVCVFYRERLQPEPERQSHPAGIGNSRKKSYLTRLRGSTGRST